MKTNLFLMLPFPSHYYPTFGLAAQMQLNGERVFYVITPNLRKVVENEGFSFRELKYLTEYKIGSFKSFLGLLIKNLCDKSEIKERVANFDDAYNSIKQLCEEIKPNHIYIDQHLAEYFFFVRPFVNNVSILHTKFYTGIRKGIPPFTSKFIPRPNLISDFYIKLLWNKEFLKLKFLVLIEYLAFLGLNEDKLWKNHCHKNGINWETSIDYKHLLNKGIKGVENIILVNKKLDFPTKKDNLFLKYLFIPYGKNETIHQTESYVKVKKNLLKLQDKKVIYLSFGTLSADFKQKIEIFINKVIELYKSQSQIFFIISTGNINLSITNSKNTFTFNFLPQQDILRYSDLFITHGGLGSISEAIEFNQPMLVVPLNRKVDQIGNAARVKFHNLGLSLDIDNYTEEEVLYKLNKLLKMDLQIKNKF